METINFFIESLKNFKSIGSLIPHSASAARKMVEPVDFNKASIIVELGGGTGVITKEILKRSQPNSRLIVFEINKNFIKTLSGIRDPRLTIVENSAVDILGVLKNININKVDYVISTLPLAQIDSINKNKIIEAAYSVLKPRGRYIQIQYSLLSKGDIEKKFSKIKINFTPFNFPPAFFYICER